MVAIFRYLLFVAFFLSPTGDVFAAQIAGRLLFVQGEVQIHNAAGESRKGKRADAVSEGERIITSRRGAVQIRMLDGALLALRGNSEYLIERQHYDPDEPNLSVQAGRLFKGFMRSITGAIGAQRPAGVTFASPVATIGIRGTVFQLLHVPEDGLADFPDVDPGTYMMVESGQTFMETVGGQLLAQPGDVLFASVAKSAAPVQMPAMKGVFRTASGMGLHKPMNRQERRFQSALLRSSHHDDAEVRESVIRFEHKLPPLENLGALSVLRAQGNERLFLYGDDDGLSVALRMLVDHQDETTGSRLLAPPGRESVNRGAALVLGRDRALASQIYWGRWQENSGYLLETSGGQSENPHSPWHYIFASNIQTLDQVLSRVTEGQLTGSFRYDLKGSTDFSVVGGSLGLRLTGGLLTADFTQSTIDVDLKLGVVADTGLSVFSTGEIAALSGSGSFSDFYATQSGGIALASDAQGISGEMSGRFAGPGAEGIITAVGIDAQLERFAGSTVGTAAFARSPAVDLGALVQEGMDGDPGSDANLVGEVGNRSTLLSTLRLCGAADCGDTLTLWGRQQHGETGLVLGGDAASPVPFQTLLPSGEAAWRLVAAPDAAPQFSESRVVRDSLGHRVDEVHWGIWLPEQFTAERDGEHALPAVTGWQYMLAGAADQPVPVAGAAFEIDNLPLTGTADFSYMGGTGLHSGEDVLQIGQASQLHIDFLERRLSANLAIQGAISDQLAGQGSFQEFYTSGVGVQGAELGGVMNGVFVGGGNGAATMIQVQDGLERAYTGTALFARPDAAGL